MELGIKEILTIILKHYEIKEGHWVLETTTGTGSVPASKPDENKAFPATLVVFEGLVLIRLDEEDELLASGNTVDASTL